MPRLIDPVRLGSIDLKNRIIMAPLTRCRSTGADGRTPNPLMRDYYVQRATAGLIISEATSVTPMGVGYPHTPGIWSDDHVRAWREITTAVHNAGGKIVLQLWHVGRISDPAYLDGKQPVAPSAIAAEGNVSHLRPKKSFDVPRALETAEVKETVEAYRHGAENAKKAGFDGVEIHGANGYLIDQFLQNRTNKRTDIYGGSIENRARFMMEVTDAVISVWGADKVGMHLSPRADSHTMGDTDLLEAFSYVAKELGKRQLAFICTREHVGPDSISPQLKKAFGGAFIANEAFTLEAGEKFVADGGAEAIAFGRLFIANPDLVKRYELRAPLNELNSATIYAEGATGYTDYPFFTDHPR